MGRRGRPEIGPPATRPVWIRLHPEGVPMMVEVPTVESRFALAFREPTTDNPGLVLTDPGDVYLVNPDGTRTLLPGSGGGGVWPTFMQIDEPAGGVGRSWLRPAGGYPDQFGVGLFFWNPTDAGAWQPVSPVRLDDDGNVKAIVGIGDDGVIGIEAYRGPGQGGATIIVQPETILLIASQTSDGTVYVHGSQVTVQTVAGTTAFGNDGFPALRIDGSQEGTLVILHPADDDTQDVLQVQNSGNVVVSTLGPTGLYVKPTVDDSAAALLLDATGADNVPLIVGHGTAGSQFLVGLDSHVEIAPSNDELNALKITTQDANVNAILVLDGSMDDPAIFTLTARGDMTVNPGGGSNPLLQVGVDNLVEVRTPINGSFLVSSSSMGLVVEVDDADAGAPSLGFFGVTPVVQQDLGGGSTLADVIALLQAYGLAGSL